MTREQCICLGCGIAFVKPGRQWTGKYHSMACYSAHRPNAGSGVAVGYPKNVGNTGRSVATEWRCSQCGKIKPLDRTHWVQTSDLKNNPCGFIAICRLCRNERKRAWHQQDKLRCLVAYSSDPPSCACCGEGTLGFLSLDHANNDGAAHRQRLISTYGFSMYTWLRRQSYPSDLGIRVLCFNCNLGRHWNDGTCPHLTA